METLPLTHPVERFLIGIVLTAFVTVVCWKAGGPPLTPAPTALVQTP